MLVRWDLRPLDLIRAAEASLAKATGKPSEACLRRATSTAYYAVFHCLARTAADLFIGGAAASRSNPAWVQTYRALEHGHALKQCEHKETMEKFPVELQDFAFTFRTLQVKRHEADYNPLAKFTKLAVRLDIVLANQAIEAFQAASVSDRRAFCAWTIFKQPKKAELPTRSKQTSKRT